MDDVNESLAAIRAFLDPLLSSSGRNKSHDLIDCLFNAHPGLPPGATTRSRVVRKALELMINVHNAVIAAKNVIKESGSEYHSDLLTVQDRQTIYALIDLICLEGLRPFISPVLSGVLQSRTKSHLLHDAVGSFSSSQYEEARILLGEAVEAFSEISDDADCGVGPLWRDRALLDTLCGCAELAYSPDAKDRDSTKYEGLFNKYLAKYVRS